MNSRLLRDRVFVPAIGVLCSLALAACGDGSTGSIASTADVQTTTTIRGALQTAPDSRNVPYSALSVNDNSEGTALVSWSAPLVNEDGSMLTDLTGFNVYYGQDPGNLDHTYQLDCGWCLWHLFGDLGPGTWYFAVKAYNRDGIEGSSSGMANKTIG